MERADQETTAASMLKLLVADIRSGRIKVDQRSRHMNAARFSTFASGLGTIQPRVRHARAAEFHMCAFVCMLLAGRCLIRRACTIRQSSCAGLPCPFMCGSA